MKYQSMIEVITLLLQFECMKYESTISICLLNNLFYEL